MRLLSGILVSVFLFASCHKEPEIPISKSVQFDKKEYTQELISERNNVKNEQQVRKTSKKSNQAETVKKNSSQKITEQKNTVEPPADTVKLQVMWAKAKSDTSKLARQKTVFEFDSSTATGLLLKVTPADSTANLRISRIIDPTGKSDGPFGREIDYPITEKGIYKVIVSESLMQGDPYSGRFEFDVILVWKKYKPKQ